MYLEYKQPKQNTYRFYQLSIERSLFGNLILTRQWGRIGSRQPRTIHHEFADMEELVRLIRQILIIRHRHHYQIIRDELTIPAADNEDAQGKYIVLRAQTINDIPQVIVDSL